jgi:hypothetical protein
MSEIDWSKAPEGATHAGINEKGAVGYFYRLPGVLGDYEFWNATIDDAKWSSGKGNPALPELIPRPSPAWSGEGPPPAGTVCEYNLKAGPWFKCEIRYVLDNDQDPEADGWQAVIWCPHLEKEQMAKASGFNFRPIRTPEQIAADEREAFIDGIALLLGWDAKYDGAQRDAGKIFDAGYRKQADK